MNPMPVPRNIYGGDLRYAFQRPLGSGGFGQVYLVVQKESNEVYAKKIIKIKENTFKSVEAEINALTRLRGCRNVVRWSNDIAYDCFKHEIHLHMEYHPMGDLSKGILGHRSIGMTFRQLEVLEIFRDITRALVDCHSRGILHRDIKPENILLRQTTSLGLRYPNGQRTAYFLADFGVGKLTMGAILQMNDVASSTAGTRHYVAPEVSQMRTVGGAADIFSLGCVMYEVCELRFAYISLLKTYVPRVSRSYDPCIKDLIMDCMSLDPRTRPTPQQLLAYLDILVMEKRNAPPGTRINPETAAMARFDAANFF